jgi:hypothetical protein
MLVFYIIHVLPWQMFNIFLKKNYNPTLSGASVASTTEIRIGAMLLLLMV